MPDLTLGTDVICQIGLVVRDIEATIKAYRDVLGLPEPRVVMSGTPAEANTRYRGKPTEARARLAFFQMGPQLSLELIEPVGGPSTWREFLDSHGEGVHHVAFKVKGTDQVLARLEGKGAALVQRGQYPGGQYAYVDSQEPLKVALELLEDFGG